ncbi:MAG TPA: hypothetical protein VNZ52_05995, partial [Candidatus Thermoplasmatota archaeon]|nr:hypothetical protein [Candidatus Thermoplasmatota archaeon]
MDVSLQILLGLVAALAWGLGDFLSRGPTGRIGTSGLILALGGVGALALVSLIAVLGTPFPAEAPWWAWALAAGLGLLNVLAAHLIFRCFYEGPLSITSPVSASYAAITFL